MPSESPALAPGLTATVEAIVTILTNRDAIAAVYAGPSGLLAGNVKGKLFIEMSTVQPETEVALAETVQAEGGTFVECPVGGTVGRRRADRHRRRRARRRSWRRAP